MNTEDQLLATEHALLAIGVIDADTIPQYDLNENIHRATNGFREWMRSQLISEARRAGYYNKDDPAWCLLDEPQPYLRRRKGRYETRHRAEHFGPASTAPVPCYFCKMAAMDSGLHLAVGCLNLPATLQPPPSDGR
eukprot:GHVT01050905.1.p1 GENE.GHVT01050905.1~~GHVT01050905.1.p1  ORF type:complete len:136 (-),score=7.54 GHVT01050905.1:377-784(-)